MSKTLRRWTEFEVDVITHPARPKDAELSRMLGRSSSAIAVKRFHLRHDEGYAA